MYVGCGPDPPREANLWGDILGHSPTLPPLNIQSHLTGITLVVRRLKSPVRGIGCVIASFASAIDYGER